MLYWILAGAFCLWVMTGFEGACMIAAFERGMTRREFSVFMKNLPEDDEQTGANIHYIVYGPFAVIWALVIRWRNRKEKRHGSS